MPRSRRLRTEPGEQLGLALFTLRPITHLALARADYRHSVGRFHDWWPLMVKDAKTDMEYTDLQIAELRTQLLEERRRRQEADRQREDEQRRREDAERNAASAQNQTLNAFLEGCHKLYTQLKPVTDTSTGTRGLTSNPTNRLYPQRILPWEQFSAQQQSVWNKLANSEDFGLKRVFPSSHSLDFVSQQIDPIGSEDELRYQERLTMEVMVKRLFEELGNDTRVSELMRVDGKISFENLATFRTEEAKTLSDRVADMTVSNDGAPVRRNTRADQFCVLRNTTDGTARPIVAIEYKAPHKLTINTISTGLRSQVWPERDVIDQDHDTFEFQSKNLMAVVVTQLFSYMIDKGVRYGYVCTGEAFVFLRIPVDDPTRVYYSVNVPSTDYQADPTNRLQRTAVAQVFAFVQQALQDEAPNQQWSETARRKLKRWKVEYLDILQKIPETERKSRDTSAYQPSQWLSSTRPSPIRLRNRCGTQATAESRGNHDNDGSDGEGHRELGDSPSQQVQTRSRTRKARDAGDQPSDHSHHQRQHINGREDSDLRPSIQDRPYCTHRCLLGLSHGAAMDNECPNVADHGTTHLSKVIFQEQLRQQMAVDRGKAADCCPLYIQGSRGALLKVRLSSHGYTVLLKAAEACNAPHLINEERVYQQLQPLQGSAVPVCIGRLCLDVPYYYNGAELTNALILSWAGRSVGSLLLQSTKYRTLLRWCEDRTLDALRQIHVYGVIHGDVEIRNILIDERTSKLMIVDFERSVVEHSRCALTELSPNRKRKREVLAETGGPSRFSKELRKTKSHLVEWVTPRLGDQKSV